VFSLPWRWLSGSRLRCQTGLCLCTPNTQFCLHHWLLEYTEVAEGSNRSFVAVLATVSSAFTKFVRRPWYVHLGAPCAAARVCLIVTSVALSVERISHLCTRLPSSRISEIGEGGAALQFAVFWCCWKLVSWNHKWILILFYIFKIETDCF
jgi:hypothetical protein